MQKMPILEYVKSLHSSVSLRNILLIGCQHILATTHLMLRSLYERELDPKNIFLLGKCYSSSRSVYREMLQDGIHVSPMSFFFDSNQSFDEQFSDIVDRFLEHSLSQVDLSTFNKIIVVDDGGQLITLSAKFLNGWKNVIGIEQTTAGYEKIKCSLQFPVINVARSQAKLVYESPLIAETVVKKSLRRIASLNLPIQKILIIGNGPIGSSIYSALNVGYELHVYDKNMNNEILNKRIDFEGLLRSVDLILGCTGNTSLPFAKFSHLKSGCVLISTSSSDREFDAVHIRRKSKIAKGCHDDVEVEGITLLNSGFPINFDGGRHSVPPNKIQFTRALLIAAIFQAHETFESSPKLVPLDIEIQRQIVSKYSEIYSPLVPNNPHLARENDLQQIIVSE